MQTAHIDYERIKNVLGWHFSQPETMFDKIKSKTKRDLRRAGFYELDEHERSKIYNECKKTVK